MGNNCQVCREEVHNLELCYDKTPEKNEVRFVYDQSVEMNMIPNGLPKTDRQQRLDNFAQE